MTNSSATEVAGAQAPARRDNIVWFVGDQLRADALSHLGNPASRTPHLDALAADGMSFRNAYSQASVCVPSRCSFLTGLYPHTTGHRTMHYLQRPSEPNILKTMKANGYEVVWIGRNDVLPSNLPKTDHCDEYYDGLVDENRRDYVRTSPPLSNVTGDEEPKAELYSFYLGETEATWGPAAMDERCVASALSYLERRQAERSTKPFFLYCTLFFPHPPYGCERPWYGTRPERPTRATTSGQHPHRQAQHGIRHRGQAGPAALDRRPMGRTARHLPRHGGQARVDHGQTVGEDHRDKIARTVG